MNVSRIFSSFWEFGGGIYFLQVGAPFKTGGGDTVADFVAGVVGEGVKVEAGVLVHAGGGMFRKAAKCNPVNGASNRLAPRLGGILK